MFSNSFGRCVSTIVNRRICVRSTTITTPAFAFSQFSKSFSNSPTSGSSSSTPKKASITNETLESTKSNNNNNNVNNNRKPSTNKLRRKAQLRRKRGGAKSDIAQLNDSGIDNIDWRKLQMADNETLLAHIRDDPSVLSRVLENEIGRLEFLEQGEHPVDSKGEFLQRKQVTAFCTAESYDFSKLKKKLQNEDVKLIWIAPDAIGVSIQNSNNEDNGTIFFFDEGVVVFWATKPQTESHFLKLLQSCEETPLSVSEDEKMHYYCGDLESTGVKDSVLHIEDSPNDIKAKNQRFLALSYGLSRSVKLAVLENRVDDVIEQTKDMPNFLLTKWYLKLMAPHRRDITARLHDVLDLRGTVNLHTELLDPPDHYWNEPELEQAYECVVNELEIRGRVERVNKRLDYTNQLVEVLRTQLQESYSHRLEWMIIILITVEIGQAFFFHQKEEKAAAALRQHVEEPKQKQ